MRTCKQYKYVSARTHSSTAILQHQRAGLRARGSRSIAVIIIIIFEFNIIIILCISSANSVLGCRSVGRSVVSVCRCAPQCSSRAAANTSSSARNIDTAHRNLRSIHSLSTAWPLALLFSSLHRRRTLLKHPHHQLRIPRSGAHQTLLSRSSCS